MKWEPAKHPVTTVAGKPRPQFSLLTLAEMRNRPAPSYLVHGVIPRNALAAVVGPPAAFKTVVALGIACSVATGKSWAGNSVLQAPVVYISGEGSSGLALRALAWAQHCGHGAEEIDELYFLPEAVQLLAEAQVDALLEAIRATCPGGLGLVVVDTVARSLVVGEENSAKDMGLFVAGADRIRTATGATVLLIHHVAKATGQMRGSTALSGALDTIIEAKRDGDALILRCEKQKEAEEFEDIFLAKRVVDLGIDVT